MHRFKSNWGSALPAVTIAIAAAAVVALVVAMNLAGSPNPVSATDPTPTGTIAIGGFQKFTGVSCADIWRDISGDDPNPVSTPGAVPIAPDADDIYSAAAMSRTNASKTAPGGFDVTTVSYLGPDLIGGDEDVLNDVVPDQGPFSASPSITTCATTRTTGQAAAENNTMNIRTAFANQFGTRPTANAIYGQYDPTNTETGGGSCSDFGTELYPIPIDNDDDGHANKTDPDCYDPGNRINFSTCGFSEVLSLWQRTDSVNVITDKGANPINFGHVTLQVAMTPPTDLVPGNPDAAADPEQCQPTVTVLNIGRFENTTVIHGRDATTDHPELAQNGEAITAGKLAVDEDGCNPSAPHPTPTPSPTPDCDPKPKGDQDHDGTLESPLLADDWDGDGCPDWDELDHQFTAFPAPAATSTPKPAGTATATVVPTPGPITLGPINGLDPFNPADCDQNFTSNIGLRVTVIHNTAVCALNQLVLQRCEPGAFVPEVGFMCTPASNALDEDGDMVVNDGCPANGAAETGPACLNTIDDGDPTDGFVNDGCPSVQGLPGGQFFFCRTRVTQTVTAGATDPVAWIAGCYSDSTVQVVNSTQIALPETVGAQCDDAVDSDPTNDYAAATPTPALRVVNDGCPAVGVPNPESVCTGAVDDDADGFVNDGCVAINAAESGLDCFDDVNDDVGDDGGTPRVNDGCPAVEPAETGAQCGNDTNDDAAGDGGTPKVNDGCPEKPDTCGPVVQSQCGDGKLGPRPPGGPGTNSNQAFIAVDPVSFPVPFSGVYNKTTNQLTFDFCLVGFGGAFFGPNVHTVGVIDAHTGIGTMDLFGGFHDPTCSGVSTLAGLHLVGAVEMVELSKNIDWKDKDGDLNKTEEVAISQHYDSDHDGCTDSEELGTSLLTGGRRDPFNKWDYSNPLVSGTPAGKNTNRIPDISAVVSVFGQDVTLMLTPNPTYKQQYDRGGTVPGSGSWNLLPPNGTIRIPDISAAVGSFGHDCTAEYPPPYTSN